MSCYRFLYLIKPRLRSAPPGALPGSAPRAAPAFGPLRAGCADARPHVDRAGGHESSTAHRSPGGQDNASGGGSAGTGMEGAPSPTAGTLGRAQGAPIPSTVDPGRAEQTRPRGVKVVRTVARSTLTPLNHARSTVCGSTADGMGAEVSGGLTEFFASVLRASDQERQPNHL